MYALSMAAWPAKTLLLCWPSLGATGLRRTLGFPHALDACRGHHTESTGAAPSREWAAGAGLSATGRSHWHCICTDSPLTQRVPAAATCVSLPGNGPETFHPSAFQEACAMSAAPHVMAAGMSLLHCTRMHPYCRIAKEPQQVS